MAERPAPVVHRPEIALARFLETFEVTASDNADGDFLGLLCTTCEEFICEVEAGDTLRVLLNTALAHADCEG